MRSQTASKLRRGLTVVVGLTSFTMMSAAYGCWQQASSPTPPLYEFSSSPQTPLGAAYPGTRELMNAPSNDPALNNDRNGVELRP